MRHAKRASVLHVQRDSVLHVPMHVPMRPWHMLGRVRRSQVRREVTVPEGAAETQESFSYYTQTFRGVTVSNTNGRLGEA